MDDNRKGSKLEVEALKLKLETLQKENEILKKRY